MRHALTLTCPCVLATATIDQDVNASFSERAPSQAQDSRNFSSYISDTAQQQDYTKGQNQALRELHIGGPEPDSRGGSRSFPGESPVFQHGKPRTVPIHFHLPLLTLVK